jgi:hypothetical protein
MQAAEAMYQQVCTFFQRTKIYSNNLIVTLVLTSSKKNSDEKLHSYSSFPWPFYLAFITWQTRHETVDDKILGYNSLRVLLQFQALTSPSGCLRMRLLNSWPSRTRKSLLGEMMPHLVAMDRAVFMLSPVTIRTVMPAC